MMTKQRYRSPSRSAEAEISLDEFDTEELERELHHRAGSYRSAPLTDDGGIYLDAEVLSTVTTLLICGQRESAREMVADQLFEALGRRL